ncbi:MAG: endonuclease domain-containing protein [Nevskia sp.]|nr:endonuclease domain-containing protein [Nevskia sp.]
MRHRGRDLARNLRQCSTDAEALLWSKLRNRQIAGCKFRRQQPIGRFVVDFVCLECKLVVELDGGQHAVEISKDETRTEFLNGEGYRVLRFWNNQVLPQIDSVLEAIAEALAASIHPSPNPLPQGERV